MSSLTAVDDDASRRLHAVLTDVHGDLAHLRALRDAGTSPDAAERALRTRGEQEVRSARAAERTGDDTGGDEAAC